MPWRSASSVGRLRINGIHHLEVVPVSLCDPEEFSARSARPCAPQKQFKHQDGNFPVILEYPTFSRDGVGRRLGPGQ